MNIQSTNKNTNVKLMTPDEIELIKDTILKRLEFCPHTRPELASLTGLKRTTLYSWLCGLRKDNMLNQGKVGKFQIINTTKKGRPKVYFYALSSIGRKNKAEWLKNMEGDVIDLTPRQLGEFLHDWKGQTAITPT